jgi:hypothetical protein
MSTSGHDSVPDDQSQARVDPRPEDRSRLGVRLGRSIYPVPRSFAELKWFVKVLVKERSSDK